MRHVRTVARIGATSNTNFLLEANSRLGYRCGMKLTDLIRERGMRQGWIAAKLGLTPSHFSDVCNGRKSLKIDYVEPLATILGVPVADIVQAATQKPGEPTNG